MFNEWHFEGWLIVSRRLIRRTSFDHLPVLITKSLGKAHSRKHIHLGDKRASSLASLGSMTFSIALNVRLERSADGLGFRWQFERRTTKGSAPHLGAGSIVPILYLIYHG